MRAYGVPLEVLTDNGKQFTGRFGGPKAGEVLFERVCRENGIKLRHTAPHAPTTTGKIERFHHSVRRELLAEALPFASLEAAQAEMDAFAEHYNTARVTLRNARPAGPPPGAPTEPVTVQRVVCSRGHFQIVGQKIQVGRVHARKLQPRRLPQRSRRRPMVRTADQWRVSRPSGRAAR